MGKRLTAGWFWPLVILALPNCGFSAGASPPTYTAVFCDIERPPSEGRHCASQDEKDRGIRLADAALAINRGDTIDVAIDDSPAARGRCGGEPEAVYFQGAFPQGQPACVSANQVSVSAACKVPCEQYFGTVGPDGSLVPDNPPTAETLAFCEQHAHLSVNIPQNPLGYLDGCTTGGKLVDFFVDPRKDSEAIELDPAGQIGIATTTTTDANGLTHTSISRSAITSPPPNNPPFDAGAASSQWFSTGDGYVEFSAAENTLSHVMGLSEISVPPLGCLFNACDDTDPGLNDIAFGISLNKDGRFYVLEHGTLIPGPDVNGSFGTYNAGDRFRVKLLDNSDTGRTATVSYVRIIGSCVAGQPCPESVFQTSQAPGHYPLRVDLSFREQGAALSDIRLMRIH